MCLSLAGRVLGIDGESAVVDLDGTARPVSLAVLLLEGEPVRRGDWVLVHTGFAVALLDPGEAAELARLRREMEAVASAESVEPPDFPQREVHP